MSTQTRNHIQSYSGQAHVSSDGHQLYLGIFKQSLPSSLTALPSCNVCTDCNEERLTTVIHWEFNVHCATTVFYDYLFILQG